MSSSSTQNPTGRPAQGVPAARMPRWLNPLALGMMGALLVQIVALVLGYATAGPEDNLAGVLLILAALTAMPLLISAMLWGIGYALRRRAPGATYGLTVASMAVSGVTIGLMVLTLIPF